jgi:hypothetical protein
VLTPSDYDEEEIGEMMIGRETEVLGKYLPQCHSLHHKRHMLYPDVNPGHRGGNPATNRLSYGTAKILLVVLQIGKYEKPKTY